MGSSFAYSAIITTKECQGYERMDYALVLHQIVTFLQQSQERSASNQLKMLKFQVSLSLVTSHGMCTSWKLLRRQLRGSIFLLGETELVFHRKIYAFFTLHACALSLTMLRQFCITCYQPAFHTHQNAFRKEQCESYVLVQNISKLQHL